MDGNNDREQMVDQADNEGEENLDFDVYDNETSENEDDELEDRSIMDNLTGVDNLVDGLSRPQIVVTDEMAFLIDWYLQLHF